VSDRLLAAAVGASLAAFGLSPGAGLPWGLALAGAVALTLLSPRAQLPPHPAAGLAALRLLARLGMVGAAALTILSRQVPLIPEAPGREWARVLGIALSLLLAVGLFSRRDFGRPATLVPTAVALLVTAALDHSRPDFLTTGARVPLGFLLPALAAALLFWAWAIASGGPRPTVRRLVAFFGTGAALAAFLVVFLPLAQPHVERAVARALVQDATGLSERSTLGDVASLAQSGRVVLRAWTARPLLLRAFVQTHFDGRTWMASPPTLAERRELRPEPETAAAVAVALPAGPAVPAAAPRALSPIAGGPGALFLVPPRTLAEAAGPGAWGTRVILAARDSGALILPPAPIVVRAPAESLHVDALGVFRARELPPLYSVVHAPGPPAPRPGPDAPERALPPLVDPRLRALADALAADALAAPAGATARSSSADRAKVRHTVAHLHSGYRYTLEVGTFRTGDPLAEFLFDKRAGYCEYFATAAAILLRLQGVPTRFVKGLSLGPHNESGGHYVARERDAHAWIEAWVDGEGWVEADPTPPGDFAALHRRRAGGLDEWLERLRAVAAEVRALVESGELRVALSRAFAGVGAGLREMLDRPAVALGLLAAAAAVAMAATWRARRRLPRRRPHLEPTDLPPVGVELRALLRRLDRHWARAGVPRPAARGLLEHLDRIPPGRLSPGAAAWSRKVVSAYYAAAFAGRLTATEELEALRRGAIALDVVSRRV
jgi:hypothetical protein